MDTLAKNEAVSLCCGRIVYGHVAVVRSGLTGSNSYPVEFTKAELIRGSRVLSNGRHPCHVSAEEKSRTFSKLGIHLEGVDHMSMLLRMGAECQVRGSSFDLCWRFCLQKRMNIP